MNRCTEWLGRHPRARQWAWFAGLWLAGLGSVLALAYPIKFLMKTL
jgi:hypothetical protein